MLSSGKKNQSVLLYILLWVLVASIHMLIIALSYDVPFYYAIIDSLVFNSLFALIGLVLWYLASYTNLKKTAVIEIIIQHLTATSLVVILWLSAGLFILNQIIHVGEDYAEFLANTRTTRAISGVLYYLVLMSIFYLIISFRELEEKVKHESRLNEMLREAELKSLRSQIRPHFLFNSLNSISSLTISDAAKAQEMVIKLSEFMRYSLTQLDEQLIPLEDELYHVGLYLDIEKVRFGNKLHVAYAIDEKCQHQKLPALILQPLMENAIKHGIYESTDKGDITIETSCSKDFLFIRVENDFDPEAVLKKGTGTGLLNVSKRLETIYGKKDLMIIQKLENTFIVELKIPSYEKD
jgi:two-component system LytT family sensor kinase